MKATRKAFFYFACIALIATPAAIFTAREIERKNLIRQHESLKIIPTTPREGELRAGEIMQNGEFIMCALNAYSDASDLKELNKKQSASVPKSILPSVDGTWYLITFDQDQAKRISIINGDNISGLTNDSPPCITPDGLIKINRINNVLQISFQHSIKPEE